jgi:hypothetical protein
MDNLNVKIAQPPGVNVSLSAPSTLYAKNVNYGANDVFSIGPEIANAIVKRDANGYANFTTSRTAAGAAAIYATAIGGSGTYAIDARGSNGSGGILAIASGSGQAIYATAVDGIGVNGSSSTGRGVSGSSTSGVGTYGASTNGIGGILTSQTSTGAEINSDSGTGAITTSSSGTYHHRFGNTSANDQSAVERVRGWFVWFFNGLTGRLKTADITADREWTLPNESGTVALERITGRTIFVDAVTGNDTRGTTSKYSMSIPFATIGAAMTASAIGDTVRVRAGTYSITSTINLNNEGNLHLEEGVVVNCNVASAPVFTLSVGQSKVISGGGQFNILGSTTKFWQQSGGTTSNQLCSIECYSILTISNSARIFDVSTGVLVVEAGTVYAMTSTIAYCAGTSSNVNYRVPFTYCARMVDMPTNNSYAQFSCVCQTIQCFGTKCFLVVGGTLGIDYETLADATNNCTFFSFEYGDSIVTNLTTIRGGRAMTYSSNPCISFTTTTGTNKLLRLYGDPFFYTGNGTNSITATSARTVLSSSASSNKTFNSNVTIVGNYLVNAGLVY